MFVKAGLLIQYHAAQLCGEIEEIEQETGPQIDLRPPSLGPISAAAQAKGAQNQFEQENSMINTFTINKPSDAKMKNLYVMFLDEYVKFEINVQWQSVSFPNKTESMTKMLPMNDTVCVHVMTQLAGHLN